MGLFQNLLETYEKCSEIIGVVQTDADGNVNEKKTLLPIFHMTFKSEICVIIDNHGNFISATRDKKENTIIIPCTEKSSGRASGPAAHPLCDQLDYVGGLNADKTKLYLEGLSCWKSDNELLNSIYSYVKREMMISDLLMEGIFKDNEFEGDDDGNIEKPLDYEKIRKIGVRFAVNINGITDNVWENWQLRNAWINHINTNVPEEDITFDYLNGENVNRIANQHPKNINSFTGNAKLLSCNDTSGFTFRGRFTKQDDAVIVDYEQSQKMHQMLRWIIANYGYTVDSQVIISWAVDSDTAVREKAYDNSFNLFNEMEETKTQADLISYANSRLYADYASKMKNLLKGYGNAYNIKEHSRKICVAGFDAATTGRMGLVFYRELMENEYLENIMNWHIETSYYLTAWINEKKENGKDKSVPVEYIGAPSFDDIIFAVYGKSHGDKSYDLVKKKTRKHLLECMFGNYTLPSSMVEMAANRASNPMSFSDQNGKFSKNDWLKSVNISCALIRKYYKQKKEEIKLELDEKRTDRDYLFGRLLSIADNMESYALYKSGNNRPTNAVKLMHAFQIKPYSTWGQLYTMLIPYKNQLGSAGFYQSLIDNVMVLFEEGDYENNSPLSPLYLLGYSAQNRKLFQSKTTNNNTEVNENDNFAE